MMDGFGPAQFGIWGTLAALFLGAALVWVAGDRVTRYADAITERTRLGQAFVGTLLLGGMVSLPEMTFAAVSAFAGHAELAVNGLVGGVGMTMIVLAITDFYAGREPLTRDVAHPVVLLEGLASLMLLLVAAAGIVSGDRLLPGVGLAGCWTTAIFALYVAMLFLVKRIQRANPWKPDDLPERAKSQGKHKPDQAAGRSMAVITGLAALAAAGVIAGGTMLAFAAEAFNQQTGLGSGMIGLIFGGISTTLPELSTTISAVKLQRFEMVFSDAWGTNAASIGLLFVADLAFPGEPILNKVDAFSIFAILLGAALSTIYLIGLLMRHRRRILRVGYDSLAVFIVFAVGLVLLWRLAQ